MVSWSAPVELTDCAAAPAAPPAAQQDRLCWLGPARSGELNAGTESVSQSVSQASRVIVTTLHTADQ